MRRTPWMLLIAALACGSAPQSGPEEGPPASATSTSGALPAQPTTNPPPPATTPTVGQPAPPAPSTCDPSIAPAAAVHDTGACPGVMPAPPTCAARVQACSGIASVSFPAGNFFAAGTSDAKGALALSCAKMDIGPPLGFGLYSPAQAGYSAGPNVGDRAQPLPSGFVAERASYDGRPEPDVLFFADDGRQIASAPPGRTLVGPAAVEIAGVVSGTLVVQQYSFDGRPRGAAQALGPAPADVLLDGATDALGHTLVIWGVYGEPVIHARWFAPDGTAETDAFQLEGHAQNIGVSAALPQNGIAIGGSLGPRWRGVITAGSTIPAPAPAWLAARDDGFTVVRGGRALAFGNELVSPDGVSCGTLDFGGPRPLGIGLDGTVFVSPDADGASALVYPKLLQ